MHTGTKIATFRQRFSELLSEKTVNDVDLARDLNVSKQTISAWKNGKRSPKDLTVNSVAQYFHVNTDWLMGFDVEKYESDQQELKDTPNENSDEGYVPKTLEARIVSFGMDKMSKEEREKVLAVLQIMYQNNPNLFRKDEPHDP